MSLFFYQYESYCLIMKLLPDEDLFNNEIIVVIEA